MQPDVRRLDSHSGARRLLEGQQVATFETVRVRKDGTSVDVSLTASAIHGPGGAIIGISKISRDGSDRVRIDQLKDQAFNASRRLASIVESSDDAIITKNLDGIITSWNDAAERMFGYTAAEAIGKPVRMIIPEDRQDEETDILERLRRGEKIDHFETIRCRKDARCLPISLTVSPLRDERGVVIGASKVARDISERRRVEELADREHRRTAFLGEMAARLSKSLDYQQTLKGIATLAVPSIADWSAIDMAQDDGQIARLAVAHVDNDK